MPDPAYERFVMSLFAVTCPYELDIESIECREPPEPDIRCRTTQGVVRWFELTEITDPDLNYAIRDATSGLKALLVNTYQGLSMEDRRAFDGYYKNASINVERLAYGRRVLLSLPKLFRSLIDSPQPNDGLHRFSRYEGLDQLYRVRIIHGSINGPVFDAMRAVMIKGTDECLIDAIRAKCERRYSSGGEPVDLLAFYDSMYRTATSPIADSTWNEVSPDIAQGPFERVWIFSQRFRRIIDHYPRI